MGFTLWRSQGGADAMIPADGCADLIAREGQLIVVGPSTRWIAATGDAEGETVGLRIPQGFASSVLGTNLVELADNAAAIEDAVPHSAAIELRAAMLAVSARQGQADALAARVCGRMAAPPYRVNFIREAAVRALPANVVAAELGESERTLRRRMLSEFGYGYATLVRIQRAANARRLLARGTTASDTAAAAGFADQAHMTREFRRLVGVTPAQFAGSAA